MKATALCTYTHLAFLINSLMDEGRETCLTFTDIYEAAQEGRFIMLLAERFDAMAKFSLLLSDPETLAEMEPALRDGAAVLEGRERRQAGVQYRGLCLAQAIVLEAIQQQFHKFPEVPPEEEVAEAAGDACGNN